MHRPKRTAEDLNLVLDDPDRGMAIFRGLYDVKHADIHRPQGSDFRWKWEVRPRGAVTVIRGEAIAGGATVGGFPPYYVLCTVTRGSIDMTTDNERISIQHARTAALITPDTATTTFTAEGTQTCNIRIDRAAIMSQASALLGAPVEAPPRFDPVVDLDRGSGQDIHRLASLLNDASARPDSALGAPQVLGHLREALVCAVLLGLDSTLRQRLERPAPSVDARVVKRAAEILAARAAEPISIADVAVAAGVGLRSLERSFKAVHGCTLRDFLRTERLELARRRLLTATPGTTVTQILHASGFGHPGEFSRAYCSRFGERPSDTLRRALGGLILRAS